MNIFSELVCYYLRMQANIVLLLFLSVLIVWPFRKTQLCSKVAVCIGAVFLILHGYVLVIMGANQGTPLSLVNIFVVSQLPAVAFGYSLFSFRRSYGNLRRISGVIGALSVLDVLTVVICVWT